MKFLISSLLFLIVFISSGQNELSYLDYHKKCRKAENLFIADSLKECFNIYNSLFNKYEILFTRDCFKAAQFAHKSNNDSLAVEYILKGIEHGLNPKFFTEDSTSVYPVKMFELKNSKYWSKVEEQNDSLQNVYLQKIDLKLKNDLMQMIRIDQDWRIKNNKWFNRVFRKGLEKKFKVDNDEHMRYLDSLFKTTGYPGSWITGIGDSLQYETNYASFNNSNLSELPKIILYHNDSIFVKNGDFLLNEIDKGHIHPRVYAMIRDFRDRHLVKKNINEEMYYNIWWERENYTSEEYKKHCTDIGCPTKQHLRNLSKKLGGGYDIFWLPFR